MKGAENTGCFFPKLTRKYGMVSLTQPDVQGIPGTETCSRKSEGDLAAEHEVKASQVHCGSHVTTLPRKL